MVMATRVRTPEEQLAVALGAFLNQKNGNGGRGGALSRMNLGGMSLGYKHDATGSPNAVYGHGPGGLFSYPGVEPEVFSAMLGLEPGLIGALPKFGSVYTDPLFTTITGVTADIAGDEPEEVCDPAIVAGLTKACMQTAPFGRYRRQTRELYLNDVGRYVNRGDPAYLRLMNRPMGLTSGGDAIMDPSLAIPMGNVVEIEMAKILFEFGVSVQRLLAVQAFEGNPTNNSGGGGYREMMGMDILIGTGKVDAETGVACPALDSDIKNFNFQNVRDFSPSDIVQALTYMYRYVRNNARRSGLLPVEWIWVMREEAFYEISAVWPISYLTSAGTMGSVRDQDWQRGNINLNDAAEQRDRMRREMYLLIDGIQVPVIFDDGITELTNATDSHVPAGSFASDIYLVPLTVLGGTPVTYVEYFQHDNTNLDAALADFRLRDQVWTTNDGAWIWSSQRTRLCVSMEGKVEPRLILRTPQLAGRLQNCVYSPLQHTRTPFPDSPYFHDGGATTRTGPSFYQDWAS